jgi:transcriptional regulator with XRE-family HTH domain
VPKSVHTATYLRFRRMLEQARLDAGMTQTDLAKKVGWQQTDISKVERGERRLVVVEFLQFAKALELDVAKFLGELQARK